jgi:hypothetical protein
MRYLGFLIIVLMIPGCFAVDKSKMITVHIDNNIRTEIDSIIMIDSLPPENNSIRFQRLKADNSETYNSFWSYGPYIWINLRLKNSDLVKSDSINILNSTQNIYIRKNDNKITFMAEPLPPKTKNYIISGILFLFVISLKIMMAFWIVNPNNKLRFLLSFGAVQIIYLIISIFSIMKYFEGFYLFYFLILVIDTIFLVTFYHGKGWYRPILAGLVSNFFLVTIGNLILNFAYLMIII